MIKNGAKGISVLIVILWLFIFNLENSISITEKIAPIQKAKISADSPDTNPSKNPIPRASFPSPSPINLPPEKNHRQKNGIKKINPANISIRYGVCNHKSNGI